MVSGGKDSSYNMMKCVAEGHEIVALANLHPKDKGQLMLRPACWTVISAGIPNVQWLRTKMPVTSKNSNENAAQRNFLGSGALQMFNSWTVDVIMPGPSQGRCHHSSHSFQYNFRNIFCSPDELDSYMYQTVGHMGITKIAEAMELPLYRMETKGQSTQTGKNYVPTDDDEVEDLFNLLKLTKDEMGVEAVAVGAIFSDYQRIRVENV